MAGAARALWPTARQRTELGLFALVATGVLMLLLPLPSALIDVALAAQLAFAVLVVLAATRVSGPAVLAIFPTLLVASTCMRLALNVSTTRLILARGDAGAVVRSFGGVAIADSLLAGAVIFLVIAIAQLLVVTRGAERVAEVAARFSLDALPGKQMAIDADVRAGFIDAGEAGRRRSRLAHESRIYGAMDGAMRFVKGDALVALVIAVVNLVGGAIVGVAAQDMSVESALRTYLTLAIGDGLAAQIPALLIAIAAGLAITRRAGAAPVDDDAGADPGGPPPGPLDMPERPLAALAHPPSLAAAAGLFAVMASIPGLPTGPFAGVALAVGAAWLWARRVHSARRPAPGGAGVARPEYIAAEPVAVRTWAPLTVELGPQLADAVDAMRPEGQFARAQLTPIRRRLAERLGMDAPAIAVRVGPESGYRLWRGDAVIDSALPADLTAELAVGPDPGQPLDGRATGARMAAHIGTRMRASLDRQCHTLVDLQTISVGLTSVSRRQPELVGALFPGALFPGSITRIQLTSLVRELVRERIAFGDLAVLLHALVDALGDGPIVDSGDRLSRVRSALRERISAQYAPSGALSAWRLDPFVEDTVRGALIPADRGEGGVVQLALEPEICAEIAAAVALAVAGAEVPGVVLVAADVRGVIAELIASAAPDAVVLAPQDLSPNTRIQTVATIGV